MRYQRGIAAAAILGTAACQAAHNDVLVFGTSTKLAIDATATPANAGIPEVTVGYKRQEAVWLPLIVNAQDSSVARIPESLAGKIYNDCVLAAGNDAEKKEDCRTAQMNAGKYMGTSGGSGDFAQGGHLGTKDDRDAYSVFASFGANFGGNGGTGSAEASGGVAQFFATGIAAQRLGANPNLHRALKVESTSEKTQDALEGQAAAEKARAEAEKAHAAYVTAEVAAICAELGEEQCKSAGAAAVLARSKVDGELNEIVSCANFTAGNSKWIEIIDATGLAADSADRAVLTEDIKTDADVRKVLLSKLNLRTQVLAGVRKVCPRPN